MSSLESDEDVPLSTHWRRRVGVSRTSLPNRMMNDDVMKRTESGAVLKEARLSSTSAGNLKTKVKRERKIIDESDDDELILGRRQDGTSSNEDKALARLKKKPRLQNCSVHCKKENAEMKEEGIAVHMNGTSSENGANGDRRRWWDEDKEDLNGIKWHSLQHNGPLFPAEYEPHGLPILYNGNPLQLEPKAEEIATFYAAKLHLTHVKKKTFNKNFFADFRASMKGTSAHSIVKRLDLCDFSRIKALLDERSASKKRVPSGERKAIREQEAERIKKYKTCIVDGRVEIVGNYNVEPPGLFLGRGEHPLMGKVKARIYPEDVTINIGKRDPVPECPLRGHRWGKIIHNNQVTWLATWKDSISNGNKYVFLSPCSAWKGQSDRDKFEKARALKMHIEKIRSDYRAVWKAQVSKEVRQRSVVMYLIDKLALRVGNEKGEDEADTVGCCSLRVEHLKFLPECTVEFDFLGKDSIRYQNSVQVEKEVYLNLKRFCRDKNPGDKVFHKLTTSGLNAYLKELMSGLTAKVFRTYNASIVLDELLQKTPPGLDLNNKLVFYNRANREVAELCNHQKSVSVTHTASMEKLEKKLNEAQEWLTALKRAKAKLSKQRENEQIEVIQLVRPKPEYKEDMDDAAKAAERKRAEAAPREKRKRLMKLESVNKNIKGTKAKIEKLNAQMTVKEDLKTVSLGTSKMNYLDPRITVAWCKKHDVPIEKIFPKTLMTKFAWSMEDSEDYRF